MLGIVLVLSVVAAVVIVITSDAYKLNTAGKRAALNSDYSGAIKLLDTVSEENSYQAEMTGSFIQVMKLSQEITDITAGNPSEVQNLSDVFAEYKKLRNDFDSKYEIHELPKILHDIYNYDQTIQDLDNIDEKQMESYVSLILAKNKLDNAVYPFGVGEFEKNHYKQFLSAYENFFEFYNAYTKNYSKSSFGYDEYEKLVSAVEKSKQVDSDNIVGLLNDAQYTYIHDYRYWREKGYIYTLNDIQEYVNKSKGACVSLEKKLPNYFSDGNNVPAFIGFFVGDCKGECGNFQSTIDSDAKKFSMTEPLGSGNDIDPKWTSTDYFTGYYNTKDKKATKKNAVIANKILKAFIIVQNNEYGKSSEWVWYSFE